LGKDISIGGKIGDILAIENVGAYGFAMSSNYNERLRPAEIMIEPNGKFTVIRRR
jgi:diaminopimelate decarboxylase